MENKNKIQPGLIEIILGVMLLVATPFTAMLLGSFVSYAVLFLGVLMIIAPFALPKGDNGLFAGPKALSILMGVIFIAIGMAWISDPTQLLKTVAILMGLSAIGQGIFLMVFAGSAPSNKVLFIILGLFNIAFGIFLWTTNNYELVLFVIAFSFLSTGIQKLMISKSNN
jgi:uncharacterized membrane protein HdeD (DUF308 family)